MTPRLHLGLVLLFVIIQLLGCKPAAKPIRMVKAVTKTTLIEFTFPQNWHPRQVKHSFDLYWQDPQEQMLTGVFVFRKDDFPRDSSVNEVYHLQIDDIRNKRSSFKLVEDEQTHELNKLKLTTTLYLVEKDGLRAYNRFTLIEFNSDDSKFAVVLQIINPELWSENKSTLEMITNSARALDMMPSIP